MGVGKRGWDEVGGRGGAVVIGTKQVLFHTGE